MGRMSREELALAQLLAEALDELQHGEADARSIAEKSRAQEELLPLLEIAEALRRRRALAPDREDWPRGRPAAQTAARGKRFHLRRRLA